MIMGGRGDGGDAERIDLSPYLVRPFVTDPPAPAAAGESLERMSIVRPPVLQAPAGPGRCRRPVEGPVAGYAVERVAARPVVAGQMLTDDDLVPWEVGEPVNVYPLRSRSACGRCWACRLPRVARVVEVVEVGRRAVAAVRRRNVTVAVVVMMVAPALVFTAARWLL
jgi:hypothetical protein